jgi:hypothetical protein
MTGFVEISEAACAQQQAAEPALHHRLPTNLIILQCLPLENSRKLVL